MAWAIQPRLPIEIRCSALPMARDCERRTAAKGYPWMFQEIGVELRELGQHVAASIGTGIHAGHAHALKAKIDGPALAPLADCIAVGIEALHQALDEAPILFCRTTAPNRNAAEQQVERMTRAAMFGLACEIAYPIKVEDALQGNLGDGFWLTGHRDVCAIHNLHMTGPADLPMPANSVGLIDLKTGRMPNGYLAQMGGYYNLSEAAGYHVGQAGLYHLPRVPLKEAQPLGKYYPVPIEVAALSADRTARRFKSSLIDFMETGDPTVLEANPHSGLCKDWMCPLWGTDGCLEHVSHEGG